MILQLIDEAVRSGARREKASALLGLSARALARWRAEAGAGDRRCGPRSSPAHKLTQRERECVLAAANRPEYRNLSPRQIVPLLADRGEYIASESSFYRVLREAGQLAHRQHSRPARRHRTLRDSRSRNQLANQALAHRAFRGGAGAVEGSIRPDERRRRQSG